MTDKPFANHRDAALALLNGNHRLSRKAGQFLGQLAVDSTPMSEAQADWLAAGVPHLGQQYPIVKEAQAAVQEAK